MDETNSCTINESRAVSANIELRGVRVHNLKSIDADIPLNQLTMITGVSGSGKSSLAFDTLYAEGQRRYIESFSASARRHLDRLEKPDAESIMNLPPAIALRQNVGTQSNSSRSTIATVTEIDDLLRVLFARAGAVVCSACDLAVEQDSSNSIVEAIDQLPSGLRMLIGFPLPAAGERGLPDASDTGEEGVVWSADDLLESGFTRAVILGTDDVAESSENIVRPAVNGRIISVQELPASADKVGDERIVVVDRLVTGKSDSDRLAESLETSLRESDGRCVILVQARAEGSNANQSGNLLNTLTRPVKKIQIDGNAWLVLRFSSNFDCSSCGAAFSRPDPSMLSFRSPFGACSTCRGSGSVTKLDFEKMVPDESLSLRAGAVVPLRGDRWKGERERLLRFAENAGVPLDVAFRNLTAQQKELIYEGSVSPTGKSTRNTEGLRGLFDRLEKRKQQAATREFLSEWRKIECCHACAGTRLRPEASSVRIGTSNASEGAGDSVSISDVSEFTIDEALRFFQGMTSSLREGHAKVGSHLVADILDRLQFLKSTGLGYLPLNREMATLSRGETQRVAMTSIAGSNLVNTLFVLDEPSVGLHRHDVSRVVNIVKELRDRGNTVVVVEHETDFLNASDHVLDIGPAAGQAGGQLVYSGPAEGLHEISGSATGRWLAGECRSHGSEYQLEGGTKHRPASGWLQLRGATCNTVRNCSVDIPLGCLCVVTGVSGAGKSSLIENVLFPAVCQGLEVPCSVEKVGKWEGFSGLDLISSVELIDDRPLAGSRRSNPATWLKVFDEIRRLFADTEDARNRNLTSSHFSFNTDSGGRCNKCEGTGRVEIDMQFLADVSMTCPDCGGSRFQTHILEVQWRARTIADVLAMTAAEAFSFFRGQAKIQKRLRSLKDVGLDYLTLGQPLATLSGGESQRLKLASCLASSGRTSSLLIMNEPTTGLHPMDVVRLLECFDGLLSVGHSLVVIEHNLDVIRHADHMIDMGPEAGPGGGQIVATGSVADIAACSESITGSYLRALP